MRNVGSKRKGRRNKNSVLVGGMGGSVFNPGEYARQEDNAKLKLPSWRGN